MDKRWQPAIDEPKIAEFWQKGKFFEVKIDKKKKPFSILLPLPNANDSMHIGHAVFVIEDIMCRYHRMLGEPVLWLPGADHAGIETQFVFEKKLAKEGKSRFDFDRETLYQMIRDFVEENRKINKFQLNRLGFGFDWRRYHYSLEPEIVEKVFAMFKKLHEDGLIYRGERIVNYCIHCGTAFSDLEVDYIEKDESLYYIDYGNIKIATTRPETIFADVAVAVNPTDNRYMDLNLTNPSTGAAVPTATIPLINKSIPIIHDYSVDPAFGTGALKITPAHDATDFEIGQRNSLEVKRCIDFNGRMINVPEELLGLKVEVAREKTVEMLKKAGKMKDTDIKPLTHNVSFCYRCKHRIEPMVTPQWFIKMKPLAEPAIKAAESGEVKFFPLRFKKTFLNWMTNIRDWNISRQIVWGPRIPAWYCLDCNLDIQINFLDKNKKNINGFYKDLKNKYSFTEIKNGLQSLKAPINAKYFLFDKPATRNSQPDNCPTCRSKNVLQETDTFDTWFLSGQWPLTTLGFDIENPKKSAEDFNYFYPTSVLDTLWDILFFWVAKMIMLGIYATGKSPFKLVHLHARVVDKLGKKMSKSKGNVANPIDLVDKYGADALRMALVYGIAPASDIPVDEKKIEAMRNFTNKVWNAARFILMNLESPKIRKDLQCNPEIKLPLSNKNDGRIIKKKILLDRKVTRNIEKHRYGQALEQIYQFFWHEFCDKYIEAVKERREEALPVLLEVLITSLILLHPFAPFVTEAVYQELKKVLPKYPLLKEKSLLIARWPN